MNNTEIIINALSKGSGGGGGGGVEPLVVTENDYDVTEMLNQFNKGGAIYFEGDFDGDDVTASITLSNPSVLDDAVFSFTGSFLLEGVKAVAVATVSEMGVEKSLNLG